MSDGSIALIKPRKKKVTKKPTERWKIVIYDSVEIVVTRVGHRVVYQPDKNSNSERIPQKGSATFERKKILQRRKVPLAHGDRCIKNLLFIRRPRKVYTEEREKTLFIETLAH